MLPEPRHVEFLRHLAHMPYVQAVLAMRDSRTALATAFQCTLQGWVERGKLTEKGRALLTARPAVEIVNLGPVGRQRNSGGST